MGKRGNHVPERWTTWLRVEEKWRMAVARTFLHTDEERRTLLFTRARRGGWRKGVKAFFLSKGVKASCTPEIMMTSWYVKLLFLSARSHDMPSCYFAKLICPTVGGKFFLFCQNYMDAKLFCQIEHLQRFDKWLPIHKCFSKVRKNPSPTVWHLNFLSV